MSRASLPSKFHPAIYWLSSGPYPEIKKEYKDVSHPITHIYELPTSETTQIQTHNLEHKKPHGKRTGTKSIVI